MEVTEKDKIFIKKYNTMWITYIAIISIVVIMIFGYFSFITNYVIPKYLKPIEVYSNAKIYMQSALYSVSRFSIVWIVILLGFLIGNFYTYLKIKNIINKFFLTKSTSN